MPLNTPFETQTAAVLTGPGNLQLTRRSRPVPAAGEVLVKISTVGICGSDAAYFQGTAAYTVNAPFVMGHEASGTVAATGDGVAGLAPGTAVALVPSLSCGECEQCGSGFDNLCPHTRYLGSAAVTPHRDGALQEYLVVPATHVLPLPEGFSLTEGALLEPMAVALHAARKTSVAGKSVLVVGGGAIGQLTSLAAKTLGAASVTVSDVSWRRAGTAVEHGADTALTTAQLKDLLARGERFDVVFDASGHPAGVEAALRAARPGTGLVVLVGNLPAGVGLPVKYISQAESWVTSTLRFAGGLAPALDFLHEHRLDISWLVEQTIPFNKVVEVFETPVAGDSPLKVHIQLS
ncbi:threonine dehydrogenase-like Zn-dependent dehydrogenase [Arthrobacter stackebrandtii]|uniref:Threonine dehydrogenase-like Zn-dependent dehydrogenase n=1 Tax=Arthrobacter stackebrandtii TaxID=272161 RepID=A0ABS4YYI1_9MICC|nr:alcohol dehydrogenase catalytic domain-containing protein [Arthrobacter stackebrandtii]MBP2413838.1 threonine dehydrogenase-like Zn-dependent dehydrogenase [Arthrobacter stackebrandtii]PYH00414.1 L-idonate 5-dehydrogenase [Arthrobacter stackebrandtii]